MNFVEVLNEKWPPIVDKTLIRSHKIDKISNYFTQYLQYLIQEYIKENRTLNYLQEIECNNHLHKLDYMIIENDAIDYFKGKSPKSVNWHYLIESQWGNNNRKKIDDFINQDFPKLGEWKTTNKNQIKIALVDMSDYKKDKYEENHDYMFTELQKSIKKDFESNYSVFITSRIKIEKSIAISKYSNVGKESYDIIKHEK